MAKKADLLAEAKKLKLEVSEKNTIAEIEAAINAAGNKAADQPEEPVEKAAIAKAGKRSAKAVKETEELIAKEERKASGETEAAPKPAAQPARSRLERAGKKLREASKLVDKDKTYTLKEALELAVKTSTTKFDATVELHANLNVDPRQADQNIRGQIQLPEGTGKTVRVAVLAEDDDAAKAKKAGADIAANEDLLKAIEKGIIDFDILIATPKLMASLGKHARTLGPKGLMPNPKSGTVTTDVVKAVSEAKAGRVEYRVDSTGIVHLGLGKVSFGAERLLVNAQAVAASIKAAKPSSIKAVYVKTVTISTTMGPGIRVQISELQ